MEQDIQELIANEIEKDRARRKVQFEIERRALWANAVVAVANANDCHDPDVAVDWADDFLAAFDQRFHT